MKCTGNRGEGKLQIAPVYLNIGNFCKVIYIFSRIFTVQLHEVQRTVLRRPFCPSVCPSNATCIVTKRKKLVSTFLYYIKDRPFQFSNEKNGWWGATPSTWNFGPIWPCWSENADFQSIFARSASAVIPSEKKFNYH